VWSETSIGPIVDKDIVGILVGVVVVILTVLLLFPALKRKAQGFFILGITFICATIFLGLYGKDWDVGTVSVQGLKYTSVNVGTETFLGDNLINARIALHFGLTGVNVTLTGEPIKQNNETIDYNEYFEWVWGEKILLASYEKGLREGLPLPIIDAVEYLLLDGEYIRFGRYYKNAGYYCFIFLWWSFPFWVIAVILAAWDGAGSTRKSSGVVLIITASFMLVGLLLYAIMKPYNLEMHFESASLTFTFGWSFYLVLSGIAFSYLLGGFFVASYVDKELVTIIIPASVFKSGRLGEVVDGKLRKTASGKLKSPSKSNTLSSGSGGLLPSKSKPKVGFKDSNDVKIGTETMETKDEASPLNESTIEVEIEDDEDEKHTGPIDESGELLEIEIATDTREPIGPLGKLKIRNFRTSTAEAGGRGNRGSTSGHSELSEIKKKFENQPENKKAPTFSRVQHGA